MQEIQPLDRHELYDDNKGNQYMTLWNIANRQNSSDEIIAKSGGLMAGRVDFYWDFNNKTKIKYQYYLEYMVKGDIKAALFWDMKTTPKGQGLLDFINQLKPYKINNDYPNHYWMSFDGRTTPTGDVRWTDSGIIEIGVFYVPNNGWVEEHGIGLGLTSTHIDVDISNFQDIEILVVDTRKNICVHRFRRDLPLPSPVDYYQTAPIGGNSVTFKMNSDSELAVDLNVKGDSDNKIKELYWRYLK